MSRTDWLQGQAADRYALLVRFASKPERMARESRVEPHSRLQCKFLEVEPLVCVRGGFGARLQVIAVITGARVVEGVLAHVESGGGHDPFEGRVRPVG